MGELNNSARPRELCQRVCLEGDDPDARKGHQRHSFLGWHLAQVENSFGYPEGNRFLTNRGQIFRDRRPHHDEIHLAVLWKERDGAYESSQISFRVNRPRVHDERISRKPILPSEIFVACTH